MCQEHFESILIIAVVAISAKICVWLVPISVLVAILDGHITLIPPQAVVQVKKAKKQVSYRCCQVSVIVEGFTHFVTLVNQT